jgi:hypothetical protein
VLNNRISLTFNSANASPAAKIGPVTSPLREEAFFSFGHLISFENNPLKYHTYYTENTIKFQPRPKSAKSIASVSASNVAFTRTIRANQTSPDQISKARAVWQVTKTSAKIQNLKKSYTEHTRRITSLSDELLYCANKHIELNAARDAEIAQALKEIKTRYDNLHADVQRHDKWAENEKAREEDEREKGEREKGEREEGEREEGEREEGEREKGDREEGEREEGGRTGHWQ